MPELVITDHHAICRLEDFGALRLRGPDARSFLQGQLSNDVAKLPSGQIVRAGLHNAQGRTLALLWLAARAPDEVLALLPLELTASIATHLRRYLLRAKVVLSDDSAHTRIVGRYAAQGGPTQTDAWRLDAQRELVISSAQEDPPYDRAGGDAAPMAASMTREQWRALDIAGGLPQVYAATSGQFVAQMLNLDCVDAISFSKGCYTGQEVIARAHYRGRVKRRMQRFEILDSIRLAPGDSAQLEDGRSLRVVEALVRADGCSEILAVAPLPATTRASGAETEEGGVVLESVTATLRARALPLPYSFPE